MSNARLLSVCLALACALGAGDAFAAPDLPALIRQAEGASAATVFLVPPMALFRNALDEAQMQASSCRYATTDPAALRVLTGLLRAGGVQPTTVYQRPDMRVGIYLTMADGTQFKLLLQDNFGGRLPVNGVAETSSGGDLQRVGSTAKPTLITDVRGWAASNGGVGTGSACDRLVPKSIAPTP